MVYENPIVQIPVGQLVANPWNRRQFNPRAMRELMATVAAGGIKEPIVVRSIGEKEGTPQFEIASGHRRWQAAKELGMTDVPCLVLQLSDAEVQDMNLVTNIQREDISPLEKARMIQSRMALGSLTQEQVASRLGKSRPWVAEHLGFLQLPEGVLKDLEGVALSIRSLRGLCALDNPEGQKEIACLLKEGLLDPSAVEARVRDQSARPDSLSRTLNRIQSPHGSLELDAKGKGKWRIDLAVDAADEKAHVLELLRALVEKLTKE